MKVATTPSAMYRHTIRTEADYGSIEVTYPSIMNLSDVLEFEEWIGLQIKVWKQRARK